MTRLPDPALQALLDDDVAGGDLSTHALGIGAKPGRLRFQARGPMTVCATEEALRLFELAGASARLLAASGTTVEAGAPLLEVTGDAASLHRGWKVAQILVEWASGIATAAAAIVAAANGVPVACTRKNVPGTKTLSIKAVRAGGATMHRLGLSETLLLFAEHRQFLDEPPLTTVARLKHAEPEKKVVVEVGSLDEALRWAQAGADVLQLEKFTPAAVAECRRLTGAEFPGLLIAAAGGIHAGNAAEYVAAGAGLLVTSAPYTAPPRDVQVTFGNAV